MRAAHPSTPAVQVAGDTRTNPLPLPDHGALSNESPKTDTRCLTSSQQVQAKDLPTVPSVVDKAANSPVQAQRDDSSRMRRNRSSEGKHISGTPAPRS